MMDFDPQEALEQPALPPQTADSEMAVLSVLMNFPAAWDVVGDTLAPHHFCQPVHRVVFAELAAQMRSGKGCDTVTLAQALDGEVSFKELGAISGYHDHSARTIGRLAQVLIDGYKARQLHALSGRLAELAFETDMPVQERIDAAQVELSKLEDAGDASEWVDAHQAAIEHLGLLESRQDGRIGGMATGLHDFDEMLDGGLYRGSLVVIGARPSMGKTALGMTIGLRMAETHAVGLLSMEMSHNDVRDRQAAILGRVSIGHIKRPQKGLQYDRIVEGVEKAKALRFFVSDRSGLTILQVRAKARALKRTHALDVLVVDYIGLMSGTDHKMSRAYQIEEISRGLKGLAKELDIAVICLAQVNREAAKSVTQVPGLHDLRDSGAIEQDADVVAFIHRQIQVNPDAGANFANYALLRVAKNRQGRTGDVHLSYQGESTRFGSWSGQPPQKGASKQSSYGEDF